MTLQKHKVDNMTESDAHMVMSWLTDAIEGLEEEQQDIQKTDVSVPANEESAAVTQSTVADVADGGLTPPAPETPNIGTTASSQSQLPIHASADGSVRANRLLNQDTEKSKSKTNLPPEMGKRDSGETVAMPFLRRKALKDPKSDDFKKADSEIARLNAWSVVDRAAGLLSEEVVSDVFIRKSFNISEDFPIEEVSQGTLLHRLLSDSNKPSSDWWESCVEFAKSIEGVTEPGIFAAVLYYDPDQFDIEDFLEKESSAATSEGGVNITILGYDTKNFDICPGAVTAFESILECSRVEAEPQIIKAAKETDRFLGLEKKYLDKGKADSNEIEEMIRSIATTHYLVGQLSNQLERDFTDEFTFTSMHVSNVLPILEKGMDLDTLEKDQRILHYDDDGSPAGLGKSHHEKSEDDEEEVDELIYTEDVEKELAPPVGSDPSELSTGQKKAQKVVDQAHATEDARLRSNAASRDATLNQGNTSPSKEDASAAAALLLSTVEAELEKATTENSKIVENRKDLESPSETGPMDRSEARPNVIFREEIVRDEDSTEYSRMHDTSGAGPAGDIGEPDNVSADAIDGLGMSDDDHDHDDEDIGKT
jgi:hypothetical protein